MRSRWLKGFVRSTASGTRKGEIKAMYAKIFTQILDSSLAEDYEVRHVFEDLLKLCDLNGVVDITHEAIARRTNAPLDVVKAAISQLEKPDPESRNPDNDGRRISRLDEHRSWGWFICNYSHYRTIASEDQRREKTAARVRRYRESIENPIQSPSVTLGNAPVTLGNAPVTLGNAPVTLGNAPVTLGNASNAMQRELEREKETRGAVAALPVPKRFKKPTLDEVKLLAAKSGLSDLEAEKFFNHYESNGWRVGRNPMKSLSHSIATWRSRVSERQFGPNKSAAGSCIPPGALKDNRGGAL